MGSQFSTGAWRKEVKVLVELSSVYILSRIYHIERVVDKDYEDSAFLSRKQLQMILKLSDRKIWEVFNIFDPHKTGKVSKLEFFSALALASSDIPSEKVGIGFMLADGDEDGYLYPVEVEILFTCATRGISLMKSTELPPQKTIKKIIFEMFSSTAVALNEKGQINNADLKAFCAVNDLCRTYFADLGTQIESADTGKLVAQRKNLQMDLVKVETRLFELSREMGYKEEDEKVFLRERGGDHSLLKFNEEDRRLEEELASREDEEAINRAKTKMHEEESGNISEAQRLRRLKRRSAKKESVHMVTDAQVFARGGKAADNRSVGGGFSSSLKVIEQAIRYKWESFEPQAHDKLYKLDVDTLEDLFDAGGVSMADADAHRCLESISRNCQGRHSCEEVIAWYREFTKISTAKVAFWRKACRNFGKWWSGVKHDYVDAMNALRRQLDVKVDIMKTTELSETYLADTGEAQMVIGEDGKPKKQFKFSREFSPPNLFMKLPDAGFTKMQSWQRNQLLKDPSTVRIDAKFNVAEVEEEDPTAKRKKKKNHKKKAEKGASGLSADPSVKSSFSFSFAVNPDTMGSPYPPLVDSSDVRRLNKPFSELKPIDFLEFNKVSQRYKRLRYQIVFLFSCVRFVSSTITEMSYQPYKA